MKTNRLKVKLAILGLVCSVLLIGCGGGGGNNTNITPDNKVEKPGGQTINSSKWNSMKWDTDDWG